MIAGFLPTFEHRYRPPPLRPDRRATGSATDRRCAIRHLEHDAEKERPPDVAAISDRETLHRVQEHGRDSDRDRDYLSPGDGAPLQSAINEPLHRSTRRHH